VRAAVQPINFRPTRGEALYLAALAMGVLLIQIVLWPASPNGPDAVTYLAIAREQIGDPGFWGNPESLVGNFWAVGYPTALAVVLRFASDSTTAVVAIQALLVASLVLIPWLLARGLPRAAQWAAPALLAATPALWWMGTSIGYEALLAWLLGFSFAGAWILYHRGAGTNGWVLGAIAALSGLLMAGALLTQTKVLVVVPIVGFLLWRAGRLPIVTAAVAVVAGLLPWMVRNALVLGNPNPLSGNGGYNLWVGNNPDATNGGSMLVAPPTPNGESMTSAAIDFIVSQPERWIELTWIKAARLLQPVFIYPDQVPAGPARTLLHLYATGAALIVLIGVVSFIGAWLLGGRRAVPPVGPVALMVTVWFATHLPFIAESRYMTTVLPLAIPVALGAWWMIGDRVRERGKGSANKQHSLVQDLERSGMAVPVDLSVPSWRTNNLVVDSRVLEPTSEVTVPAQECGLAKEHHAWPALMVRTLRGVTLDVDSCLAFTGDRVIAQSGTGTRAARDAAFVSGATWRIRGSAPTSIAGPIAPLGDVHHHYHVVVETLPRVLHAAAYRPDVTFVTTQSIPDRYRAVLDDWGVRIMHLEPGAVVKAEELVLVDQPELFWPRRADLTALSEAFSSSIAAQGDGGRRIYISRRNAKRAIGDEAHLEEELRERGLEVVTLEQHDLGEQMRILSESELIVSGHGAGLASIVATRPGSRVVEVTSGEHFEECYRRMAALLALDYICVRIDGSEQEPQGSATAVETILASLSART